MNDKKKLLALFCSSSASSPKTMHLSALQILAEPAKVAQRNLNPTSTGIASSSNLRRASIDCRSSKVCRSVQLRDSKSHISRRIDQPGHRCRSLEKWQEDCRLEEHRRLEEEHRSQEVLQKWQEDCRRAGRCKVGEGQWSPGEWGPSTAGLTLHRTVRSQRSNRLSMSRQCRRNRSQRRTCSHTQGLQWEGDRSSVDQAQDHRHKPLHIPRCRKHLHNPSLRNHTRLPVAKVRCRWGPGRGEDWSFPCSTNCR